VTIRVLIADDQELVRTGLRMVLKPEPDIELVGEATDGRATVAQALRLRPDVVLMDIRMPGLNGLEATREIGLGSRNPPKVLVLTTFDLDEYVYEALRAGASGFLLKDTPTDQLLTAIRIVADGGALLAPSVTRRLIEEFARRPAAGVHHAAWLDELTPRELEVLQLLARGRSNLEIAADLTISDATVKTHVAHLLRKLGARDRTQAVVLAYEAGIVRATET
jgi:DNA-binding NarL/FixJ family response regulator